VKVNEFAASSWNHWKGKAAKPTKMYVRNRIVKKKGRHHSIGIFWPCFAMDP